MASGSDIAFHIELPTKKDVLELCKRENEARYSKEYIAECDAVASKPDAWLTEVTPKMQTNIVRDYLKEKFNNAHPHMIHIFLSALRTASSRYPEESIVKDMLYVKNNKANRGKYKAGDDVPNIPVHYCDGRNSLLYDHLNNDKPTIIFAGSHT